MLVQRQTLEREAEIPVQRSLLVRIDNTLTVPGVTAANAEYNASR